MHDLKLNRKISYLLRHNPEDLVIDKNGWCEVDALLKKLNISKVILQNIVETNNKKRFSFNEDETKIRANQGHSIKVDVELKKKIPPPVLYHGTTPRLKKEILKYGLLKMRRNHVHLSGDEETAIKVGKRHCRNNESPWVIKIRTGDMIKENIPFYLSENGVWLVDEVPSKYFEKSS